MKNRFSKLPKGIDERERNAYRIAIILLVVLGVFDVFSAFNYIEHQGIQLLFAMVLSYAATGAIFVCAWLIRQGRVNTAVWGLILTTLISLLLSPLLGSGLGIIYSVTAVLVTAVIAFQGLESRQIARANVVGVVFGALIFLLDLFAPFGNSSNLNANVTYIILFALLLILVFVAARQFRDFMIRTKLIILFLIVSIVPLVVIAARDTIQTQRALTNGAELSLKSGATQTANSLDTFIQTTLNSIGAESQLADLLNYLLVSPAARNGTVVRERTLAVLQNLAKKDPVNIISYALVDTAGNILLDSTTGPQYNEANEAYFSLMENSDNPIVTPVTYSEDKTTSIIFATKILNINNNKYAGSLRVKYKSIVLQEVITNSIGATTDTSVLLLDQLNIRMADTHNPSLILKSIVPLEPNDYLIAVSTRRFLNIPGEEQATNYSKFKSALDKSVSQPFFTADITPDAPGDDTIAVAHLKTQPWIIAYSRPTSVLLADVQEQTRVNIILALGVLLVISIITALTARSLTNPITDLAKVVNSVEQGDLSARAEIQSRDEIGALAGAFNLMTNRLQETLNSLEQRVLERTAVAETARVEAEKSSTEAKSARKRLEAQIWLATGQTQLADAIRGEQQIAQLAEHVISQLCQYMSAQAGALFLLDKKTLTLVGRYAFAERAGFNGTFQLGEGLVGQAALDGRVMNLENIPPGTLTISTGLVDIAPRQVIAIPFYANREVVGVLELVTLSTFSQNHFELLERISESVGVAFRTAQTRQRLAELLMESQHQAEELQAQEEELRAANEELQAQAENLKVKQVTQLSAVRGGVNG